MHLPLSAPPMLSPAAQQHSPEDSAPAALHRSLLQLEALRCWRVACHQGVPLAAMEDMYPHMVHLSQPPQQWQDSPQGGGAPQQQQQYTYMQVCVGGGGKRVQGWPA